MNTEHTSTEWIVDKIVSVSPNKRNEFDAGIRLQFSAEHSNVVQSPLSKLIKYMHCMECKVRSTMETEYLQCCFQCCYSYVLSVFAYIDCRHPPMVIQNTKTNI